MVAESITACESDIAQTQLGFASVAPEPSGTITLPGAGESAIRRRLSVDLPMIARCVLPKDLP
jgi:hypothetical protein